MMQFHHLERGNQENLSEDNTIIKQFRALKCKRRLKLGGNIYQHNCNYQQWQFVLLEAKGSQTSSFQAIVVIYKEHPR